MRSLFAPPVRAPQSRLALCALALIAAFFAVPALAHEGHDHGDKPPAPLANVAPRGEASSESFELVAIARGTELAVYLDRFATNEPVEGAQIEAETPSGPVKAVAAPGQPYRIAAPFLAKPGRVELIFTVTAGDAVDILPLSLEIPATGAAGSMPTSRTIAGFSLAFAGANAPLIITAIVSFALGLVAAAMFAFRRRRSTSALAVLVLLFLSQAPARAHEGHDHAPAEAAIEAPQPPSTAQAASSQPGTERAQRLPDGTVFAPKPVQRIFAVRTIFSESASHRRSVELPGRIIPDPNASGYVQAAVGGRLSPPPGGFPRLGTQVKEGDVLAYVTPPLQAIDVSDMRQRQGELDQQINIVERRLARFEQLAPSGAVARSQLEDTRLELQGLRERRALLDKARRDPEALVAPVAGVVADGNPIAGQIVASSAVVFHIVDPARLWVEALSFEALAGVTTASANTGSGKTLSLTFRGSGFADRSQSVPVHFAVEGDTAGLRAGQFVTVLVTTGEEAKGVAVPRASLVRAANGQDFVYEHVAAERFEPRPVRTEPLDGERVLIAAGIGAGKRIVSQGAELLDHVR